MWFMMKNSFNIMVVNLWTLSLKLTGNWISVWKNRTYFAVRNLCWAISEPRYWPENGAAAWHGRHRCSGRYPLGTVARGADGCRTQLRHRIWRLSLPRYFDYCFLYWLTNTAFYVDDRFSGTNLPSRFYSYSHMVDDVKVGQISTIITKDISSFRCDYSWPDST